jgi:hypothetical protein
MVEFKCTGLAAPEGTEAGGSRATGETTGFAAAGGDAPLRGDDRSEPARPSLMGLPILGVGVGVPSTLGGSRLPLDAAAAGGAAGAPAGAAVVVDAGAAAFKGSSDATEGEGICFAAALVLAGGAAGGVVATDDAFFCATTAFTVSVPLVPGIGTTSCSCVQACPMSTATSATNTSPFFPASQQLSRTRIGTAGEEPCASKRPWRSDPMSSVTISFHRAFGSLRFTGSVAKGFFSSEGKCTRMKGSFRG